MSLLHTPELMIAQHEERHRAARVRHQADLATGTRGRSWLRKGASRRASPATPGRRSADLRAT